MADAAYIQGKIYYGYGQAAKRLGTSFDFYRSVTPLNPIVAGNIIGNLLVSLNQNWAYDKANKYGNAIWQMVADARQPPDSIGFTIGDYFLGTSLDNVPLTYFVISKQLILPILSVECNKVVTIQRANQDNDPDSDVYSGYTPGTATVLASGLPVSILKQAIGRDNKEKLPTDTLMPRWDLLMPNLGNVTYKNRDIVIDELGFRYVVAAAEKTDFGWRCAIELLGT